MRRGMKRKATDNNMKRRMAENARQVRAAVKKWEDLLRWTLGGTYGIKRRPCIPSLDGYCETHHKYCDGSYPSAENQAAYDKWKRDNEEN